MISAYKVLAQGNNKWWPSDFLVTSRVLNSRMATKAMSKCSCLQTDCYTLEANCYPSSQMVLGLKVEGVSSGAQRGW